MNSCNMAEPVLGEDCDWNDDDECTIMTFLTSTHGTTPGKLSHQIPNFDTGRARAAETEPIEKRLLAAEDLLVAQALLRTLQPHPATRSEAPIPQVSEPALGEDDDWSDEDEPAVPQGHESQPQLIVATGQDVAPDGGECTVVVSVRVQDPPLPENLLPSRFGPSSDSKFKVPGRVPSDVCCVIDISDSMNDEATYEDEWGNKKSDRLSYLDVVTHAVKTLMHMLGDQDRLALVAFNDRADLVFAADFMTTDGRGRAMTQLEALRPRSTTNIWEGLRVGLEALRTCENIGGAIRPKTVLLLTDGVPVPIPPRGCATELRDYKELHTNFGFEINTFGFGHKIDSELLLDLAVEGHGTYAFIPDALVVGTSFVNSCASILSTFTQEATLHLTAIGGAQIKGSVLGVDEHTVAETSWGHVVDLGSIHFGGTREVALPMQVPAGDQPYIKAVLVYADNTGKQRQVSGCGVSRRAEKFAIAASARSDVICTGYDVLVDAVQKREIHARDKMTLLVGRLEALERLMCIDDLTDDWVPTLRSDVGARASKALQGSVRFNRWGKHYLRAFIRAHQVQRCTNFMDQSLQVYGGSLFRALREEGDSIFVSLPPPRRYSHMLGMPSPIQRAHAPSPNMNVYYGGCGGG